ncbi:MAG: type VI secretion system-associated FHA domain protein TagH [Rhodobacteraceae bacterium]|nr:type VI secretion system-associated FHA domain protein TagH [Paracoccaceae bacterium]
MSVTVSFQPTGPVPGNAGPITMSGGSLSIGRGPANDLVLPDPDRMLSKSHCVIEDQGGNVVVIDLSTNGTYLNYAKVPLGPVPTPLSNGDVLTLGLFELVVSITPGAPSALDLPPDPLADLPVSPGQADLSPDPLDFLDSPGQGGDVLDELLGGQSVPTGPSQITPVDPIDELLPPDGADDDDPFFQPAPDGREGQGASFAAHHPSASDSFDPPTPARSIIPDDWDDLLAPDPGEPSPPKTTAPAPDPDDPFAGLEPPQPDLVPPKPAPYQAPPEPTFQPGPLTPAEPAPTAASDTAVPARPASQDAARAFLDALGADDMDIRDEDLADTMARAGAIMRELVSGIREILMTRSSIKSEFRIEQTMIAAGGNNPLKFSVSPEQAIEALLRPRRRGYMTPDEAARQALDDIAAHEVAMVAGMETAIKSVLAKLSPEVLAERIETSGRLGNLFRGRKAQYWDVYEKMFAEISDQAEHDFHHFFSREFARAYQDQLNRLKDRDDK